MAKNNPAKKAQPTAKKTSSVSKQGTFDKLNAWLEERDKKVFYVLLFLSTLFTLLLFDSKVSLGGDDSSYIERAWSLIHEGKFPYFQGPGYPVMLSVFMRMFGLNEVALKFLSVLSQFGFVWITYLTFRKRVPYIVLFALIAFISFNNFIQYYASQTYTETFFLLVQSVCLYITFNIIDNINKQSKLVEGFKQNYKNWLLFGLMFLILTISKSIAFVTLAGVVFYFLLNKNYKEILYVLAAYLLFRITYQLITTAIYGANESNQLELMLRKDLYKPEGGHEDFSGMIDRFFNNFNTYVSWHVYRILNLRMLSSLEVLDSDTIKTLPALSFLSTLVLGITTFFSYKRNKFIFFSSIYVICLVGGIFFGVQANNMQSRLIIIAMPFLFLVLFYGIYDFAKRNNSLQFIFLAFSAVMLVVCIGKSSINAKQNFVALKKNLGGDMYYGYTPDWENFLKLSKYCADSLPKDAQVVSRKPNMSFIYGNGKKFVGQYIVTSENADTVLMVWKKENVQYVLMPALRQNPKKNNGRIINTIQRMLSPIGQKYPEKLKLIKTQGDEEPAFLYELKY